MASLSQRGFNLGSGAQAEIIHGTGFERCDAARSSSSAYFAGVSGSKPGA